MMWGFALKYFNKTVSLNKIGKTLNTMEAE